MQSGVLLLAALAGAAFGTGAYAVLRRKHRIAIAGHQNIVIVGSSSGIGRAIALQYARRGASLCLIARRNQEQIKQVCLEQGARDCCAFTADASKAEDIVGLHSKLRDEAQWAQVDTLIICAGALTVQPVLTITGQVDPEAPSTVKQEAFASLSGLQNLVSLATQSYAANVLPAVLVTSTLLPLLLTSNSARVCVLSSVAAELPAPTRAIYAANKAAASMLMRSLRIELQGLVHAGTTPRGIGVTLVHPASIDTGLRSSALDSYVSASGSGNSGKERKTMSPEYVADQTISALDNGVDELWLPISYWWISKVIMPLWPGIVINGARKKYGFV